MKRNSIAPQDDISTSSDSSEGEIGRNEAPAEENTLPIPPKKKRGAYKRRRQVEQDCQMSLDIQQHYDESGPKNDSNEPINLATATNEQWPDILEFFKQYLR